MAKEIEGLTDKVHALLNNAGGVRSEMIITPEDHEATFAGNHLGHLAAGRSAAAVLARGPAPWSSAFRAIARLDQIADFGRSKRQIEAARIARGESFRRWR
jgi:NAD(P)-dependent dehydrogenase (short-subunit alcohol dehydrogenase family)